MIWATSEAPSDPANTSFCYVYGGRCRIRTCDFHRVKVPFQGHFIDGKGLKNRRSRQNRPNRRLLPQKCHKLFSSITNRVGRGLAVAEQPRFPAVRTVFNRCPLVAPRLRSAHSQAVISVALTR